MVNYNVRKYASKQEGLMKEADVNVIIHHFDSREFFSDKHRKDEKTFLATFQ